MFAGYDIFYFSNDWNSETITSSRHIAEQLAKDNRLFYIEAGGIRLPRASSRDVKRIFVKLFKFLRGPIRIAETLWVLTLFQIPLHRFKLVRQINRLMIGLILRRVCKKFGVSRPVMWFISPHNYPVLGMLDERLVVYYLTDDFSTLPGVDREAIRRLDAKMIQRADVVFAASETVWVQKKRVKENCHLSPHGVDWEHFSRAMSPSLPVPKELLPLGKPIIGYMGAVEEWIDLDLIKSMALKRPSWNIVLIGRIATNLKAFKDVLNVHFLGTRPYCTLPGYLKAFDVAIIPYKMTDQTYNANPKKLREYLAAGKPVVSVRIPEVEKFKEVVEIADSPEEFLEKIEACLLKDDETAHCQRLAVVCQDTWEKHYESLSCILGKTAKDMSQRNVAKSEAMEG